MKSSHLYALAGLILGFATQPVGSASLPEIRARGFLSVAVASDPSPFGNPVHGKPNGFDAELLAKFRSVEALDLHTQPMPRSEIAAALADGTIDLAAASLPITEETQKSVNFGPPLAEVTLFDLTRAEHPVIHTLADLSGRKFGIAGDSDSFLEQTEIEHRIAKAGGSLGASVEYPTTDAAMADLADAKIDYVIGDIATLSRVVADHPGAFAIGQAISAPRYVAWASAKNEPEIATMLRDFMLRERADGDLATLQQRWLGRHFEGLPDAVVARNWWLTRTDKPTEFPIPSIKDPD